MGLDNAKYNKIIPLLLGVVVIVYAVSYAVYSFWIS